MKYHNIVGVLSKEKEGFGNRISGRGDGVVAYESAHADDAHFGEDVDAEHMSVHRHPLAVLEVRRILNEHWEESLPQLSGQMPVPRVQMARLWMRKSGSLPEQASVSASLLRGRLGHIALRVQRRHQRSERAAGGAGTGSEAGCSGVKRKSMISAPRPRRFLFRLAGGQLAADHAHVAGGFDPDRTACPCTRRIVMAMESPILMLSFCFRVRTSMTHSFADYAFDVDCWAEK